MEGRQASCGANGNTDTICSPQQGQVWKNNTWYQITWNPSYPTYAASDVLDIYLYYVKNYQNTMIKSWTDIAPSKANYPVFVDDSWFPSSTENTHDAYVYIVGGDVDPDQEMSDRYSDYPAPVSIQVIGEETRDAHEETPAAAPIQSESKRLQPWVIAIVAVSCVAALAACIVMIWAVRHVRRRKLVFDEKTGKSSGHGYTSSLPSSSMLYNEHFKNDSTFILPPTLDGSVRSTPRMMMASCLPDSTIIRPQSTASCSNISTRSSDIPPISSADALMIADTFRQRMRRPDWQHQPQRQEHDEESKRRQLSEELLMQELAAEGTLMKKVGKRAQLLSAFAAAEDDSNNNSNNNNNNTSSSSR
ncbi:hypothetical protein BJV82DRAFT_717611 [Fennellomyces sp. T-0311]|nr:hypothetical protein BJV82DRAFT_717611 [Fennellomyces sp. T-0311]